MLDFKSEDFHLDLLLTECCAGTIAYCLKLLSSGAGRPTVLLPNFSEDFGL